MKENNLYICAATNKETVKKNLHSNKLTQLMRSSIFDRNAVNTNINLASKKQTDYFKLVNKNLSKNLFEDLNEPRRRKAIDLDISYVRENKNYGEFLGHKEDDSEVFNKNNSSDEDKKNDF